MPFAFLQGFPMASPDTSSEINKHCPTKPAMESHLHNPKGGKFKAFSWPKIWSQKYPPIELGWSKIWPQQYRIIELNWLTLWSQKYRPIELGWLKLWFQKNRPIIWFQKWLAETVFRIQGGSIDNPPSHKAKASLGGAPGIAWDQASPNMIYFEFWRVLNETCWIPSIS